MKKFLPIILLILFLFPLVAQAGAFSIIPPKSEQGENECFSKGKCNFCDALWIINRFTKLVLGLAGSVALLMFIYGGFLWITSLGAAEKIKQGQHVMSQTVVAIIILVMAWATVNFVITGLVSKARPDTTGVDFKWYELCNQNKK